MTKTQKQLINFVKAALKGEPFPDSLLPLTTEEKNAVIEYGAQQGLLPFLQYFPEFSMEDVRERFFQYLVGYVYEDSRQTAEIDEILDAFEKEGIYCIPLKGIVTKRFYPASELRTMGDLDMLYQPEQTEKLKSVMESLDYSYEGEAAKHDHYRRNGKVVEMHKELMPVSSRAYRYFQGSWQRAVPEPGKKYICQMSPEDHYLFTFYHLLEHFIRGGIGIRMVLDLYILSGQKELDQDYVDRKLKELEVSEFYGHLISLAQSWFGDQPSEENERELEEYIVNGGIFGNRENDVRNAKVTFHSGKRFLLHTIFPDYHVMKSVFPWLKTPLLLPAAWLLRFWNVWTKRRQNIRLQFDTAAQMGKEEKDEIRKRRAFFEKYGLRI